jgi:hypothetical protein
MLIGTIFPDLSRQPDGDVTRHQGQDGVMVLSERPLLRVPQTVGIPKA